MYIVQVNKTSNNVG